ncbi:MAG: recombination mediator RecR [Rickettsiales bacterium]
MHESVARLVKTLARLPGMGKRSAERAALHLMREKESRIEPLLFALSDVKQRIVTCSVCRNLDAIDPCHVCADPRRAREGRICVVEDVSDLWAIERSGAFKGRYHVLGGALSAIEGRGPDELCVPALVARVKSENVEEVIVATATTLDGRATASYVADALEPTGVAVTRIAQGVPVGGELSYLDEGTLLTALTARRKMEEA